MKGAGWVSVLWLSGSLLSCRDLPSIAGPSGGATTDQTASVAACGNAVCDPGESCTNCPQDCNTSAGGACPRVGIFYSVWHIAPYTALQAAQQMGQPQLTVEDVLRSRVDNGTPPNGGPYSLGDMLRASSLVTTAMNFYYQHRPARGFYCIYQRRSPGDINYDINHEGSYLPPATIPDCADAATTVQDHATQLSAAAVDFAVVDMVNFPNFDNAGDALGLRPFEVLAHGWQSMRQHSLATPDLAAWARFPISGAPPEGDGTMIAHLLNVYNDPQVQSIFMRDRNTGKKVLFYYDSADFDPNILSTVQSNGGKNDIIVVPLNTTPSPTRWSIGAPCQQGVQLDDTPCSQPGSSGPLGTQVSVSASFQSMTTTIQGFNEGWAGLPFGASGTYGGQTLRKQFATALATQPNYVIVSGWNENTAQPFSPNDLSAQAGPVSNPNSMGLETDATAAGLSFFDTYGAEFTRDIEPSQEFGDTLYTIMGGCAHLLKSGATQCTDATNACCQGGNFSEQFAFYNRNGLNFGMQAGTLPLGAGMTPLYDCGNEVTAKDSCVGGAVPQLIGYGASAKGGGMLRSLFACQTMGQRSNTMSGGTACAGQSQFLAYVR